MGKINLKSLRQRLIVLSAINIFLISHYIYSQSLGALIPDFRVNDDATNYTQEAPSIGVDGNGNFVITWNDERNTPINLTLQVYCQRFALDGTRLGVNFRIGQDTAGNSHIAVLGDGRFIVAWGGRVNGKPDIYFQRFLANGTPNGGMFKVNDTNVVGAYASLNDIDADSLGNFAIVWNDYRGGVSWQPDVYGQRYDSAGNRIGNNFKINDNTNQSSQAGPRIAVNKDGSFVVCWNDNRSGSSIDIFMQRYDKFGNPIGINQRVDDDLNNSEQNICDVATDGKGYFVIAFDDYRVIYNVGQIFYQLYDTLGNKIGPNQRADNTSNDKGATKVSMRSNGKFVIMWEEERFFQTYIAFGQRFNKDGSKIGIPFQIPVNTGAISSTFVNGYLHGDRIYSAWNDIRNGNFDVYSNVRSFIKPESTLVVINNWQTLPESFMLYPPYPNPFNPETYINYSLPKETKVTIKVYDILGKLVKELVNEYKEAGYYTAKFDGTNFASGVYFYRIVAGSFVDTKKMVLIK